MPLSQNRASETRFKVPLSSIGAPELKTVLLSLDGAPEYCHNHKKPLQIENTPKVCTAGSRVGRTDEQTDKAILGVGCVNHVLNPFVCSCKYCPNILKIFPFLKIFLLYIYPCFSRRAGRTLK